jgi:hypothetical protein
MISKKRGQVWVERKDLFTKSFSQSFSSSRRGQVWVDGKISNNKSTRLPNIAKSRRGQVWVETMIYTLIAFALIAAVLAFARPKIEELQDKAVIDQSIKVLDDLNSVILLVIQGGTGNQREISIGIKKGEILINPVDDKIIFQMNSILTYSEPGKNISVGSVIVNTEKKGKDNKITVTK